MRCSRDSSICLRCRAAMLARAARAPTREAEILRLSWFHSDDDNHGWRPIERWGAGAQNLSGFA
jgi:hypothetical protein